MITQWSTAALYKHLALIQQRKKIQLLEKNIRLKLNYTEFLFSARMHYIELEFFVV